MLAIICKKSERIRAIYKLYIEYGQKHQIRLSHLIWCVVVGLHILQWVAGVHCCLCQRHIDTASDISARAAGVCGVVARARTDPIRAASTSQT